MLAGYQYIPRVRDVATVGGSGRQQPPLDPADHHSALKPPLPTTTKKCFFCFLFFCFFCKRAEITCKWTDMTCNYINHYNWSHWMYKNVILLPKTPQVIKIEAATQNFLATTQNS